MIEQVCSEFTCSICIEDTTWTTHSMHSILSYYNISMVPTCIYSIFCTIFFIWMYGSEQVRGEYTARQRQKYTQCKVKIPN